MISAFSGLTPAKAHFYVHQALLRAKTGRDMESDVPAAEILPVRSREMLPVAFAREVSERMVAFAAQHFSEPPDGADALVHFVIGQEV